MARPSNHEQKLKVIQRLLAQAERAGTEEEAVTFSAKAEELMVKYSISEAMLRQEGNTPHKERPVTSIKILLDDPYSRQKASLAHVIAEALGCTCVRTRRRSYDDVTGDYTGVRVYAHVFGLEADLDMTSLLYASLHLQAATLLAQVKGDVTSYGQGATKQARISFFYGFISRVGDRLREIHKRAAAEAEQETGKSTALALRTHSDLVNEEKHRTYPTLKPLRSSATVSVSHYAAGQRAGDRASISAQQGVGSQRREIR